MVNPARPETLTVRRGEVWLVTLDPTVGSEIRKTRPGVIISPPEMHDYLRTVLIAPMTTVAGRRHSAFRCVSKAAVA